VGTNADPAEDPEGIRWSLVGSWEILHGQPMKPLCVAENHRAKNLQQECPKPTQIPPGQTQLYYSSHLQGTNTRYHCQRLSKPFPGLPPPLEQPSSPRKEREGEERREGKLMSLGTHSFPSLDWAGAISPMKRRLDF
jgi:hypothetical protein